MGHHVYVVSVTLKFGRVKNELHVVIFSKIKCRPIYLFEVLLKYLHQENDKKQILENVGSRYFIYFLILVPLPINHNNAVFIEQKY